MTILDKLITLTEKNKIIWDMCEENSYTTIINGIYIKVIRHNVDDENYYAYRHQMLVEAPYLNIQTIEDDYRIEQLYNTILNMNGITSFSILDKTLNKMMEKH